MEVSLVYNIVKSNSVVCVYIYIHSVLCVCVCIYIHTFVLFSDYFPLWDITGLAKAFIGTFFLGGVVEKPE